MTEQRVGLGKVVSTHYVLLDRKGKELGRSNEPCNRHVHGSKNALQGFQKHLDGLVVGDVISFVLSVKEGFGKRRRVSYRRIPIKHFPKDLELRVGMRFQTQPQFGSKDVYVKRIDEDSILCSPQHPFCGEQLHFTDVTIVDIRDATAQEIATGWPTRMTPILVGNRKIWPGGQVTKH